MTTQVEYGQNILSTGSTCLSETQPRKPSDLQEESISDAHSAGSPYPFALHSFKDAGQPSPLKSGNIDVVSTRRCCA